MALKQCLIAVSVLCVSGCAGGSGSPPMPLDYEFSPAEILIHDQYVDARDQRQRLQRQRAMACLGGVGLQSLISERLVADLPDRCLAPLPAGRFAQALESEQDAEWGGKAMDRMVESARIRFAARDISDIAHLADAAERLAASEASDDPHRMENVRFWLEPRLEDATTLITRLNMEAEAAETTREGAGEAYRALRCRLQRERSRLQDALEFLTMPSTQSERVR